MTQAKPFRVDDLSFTVDEEQPLPHTEEDSPLPEDNMPSDAEQALQEMVGLTRLKEDLQEARDDGRLHEAAYGIRARHGTGQPPPHAVLRQSRYRKDDGWPKLIGQLYHQMGLLSSGHTIENMPHKNWWGDTLVKQKKHISKP